MKILGQMKYQINSEEMLINPEIATLQDERKIPKRGMGNEKG